MMSSSVSPEEGNVASAEEGKPRDADYWARNVSSLKLGRVPSGAINLNVQGKRPVGPLQGFGAMWQKTYRVRLSGVKVQPTAVIKVWKEHFPEFWPKGNRFYGPLTGIAPGEVGLINMALPGGVPLSTGVMILYADDESFTFMTPQGHVFAGWITFSAYEDDERSIAQVQVLIRANDPLYEIGFRMGAAKSEDRFWENTLKSLATYFGVEAPEVETQAICVDRKIQWSQAKNVWHNAGVRTTMYLMMAPVRVPLRWMRRRNRPEAK
ncbi:MAG TPA: hypothetical protein VKT82_16875 [Ktedonobacterales bacterium]|nr:hypothetical protein [Ktedonobacterales bacterium]